MVVGPGVKVAVIMPAYNAAAYVEAAIGSLLDQRDAADLDVIVVDDGSSDATGALVERIAETAPEVRLLRQPHRGIPQTRNTGLAAVQADAALVTFLDADDLSPPGRFARDIAAFARRPWLDMHWGMTREFGDPSASGWGADAARDARGVQLGALLIRRELAVAVGGFDETLEVAEDADFLLRLLDAQPLLERSEEVAVLYRRHAANISSDRERARTQLARAYLKAAHRRHHGAPVIAPGTFTLPRPAGQRR